ncbi:MAG: glycosyltransferase family 9 protein [Rhodospirillaceae bacterium]|jgi:ADP-heptose:LPS heptosyltransferase|nr:glycosyltransferase family 9 protein [Rhodospirillaceae bacterium]MBT5299060.1 glycosyltransferase family 9 protein [Rhodospirillaceae bacterium]MBT6086616.1 glycosyltransferase family 9 protein [Rhodospirillaceae bacterium]MBT7250096.1 glycosyltransferase family 9 protein [Rhodospirillaceae bacterium]MBT7509019.1 glycosyltransferase family 9 protein [Rhodospirillaceae bacterium]
MSAEAQSVQFKSSPFWRLMPAGMRKRWWLFRPFDWIARHWPTGNRGGLLVIRMDGIGDMVLFRNSLDHYAAAFGVAKSDITVLGCESWGPVADQVFAGYRVVTINEHKYARRAFYRFGVNLRIRRMAPAVTVSDAYFRRALMADSLAWVAAAPRTVVSVPYINERTRAEYTWYLSQVEEIIDTGAYPIHETERHAAFLKAVTGRDHRVETPRLIWAGSPPPAHIQAPYVVLNPGSNEFGRRWPLAQFQELARWLASLGYTVVFVGKTDEKAAPIKAGALSENDRVIDMTGRTKLAELLDLIQRATLLVSNDTGPAHVGIGLSAKTVVIVGGGHFGCFVPYPEGVRPDHARFVHRPMDCYHCFWRCHKREGPMQSFPCVAAVTMAEVQSACVELVGADPVNMDPPA